MGDAEKHKEAEDPEYEQEVIRKIYGYHERMRKIVIDQRDDGDKPADMVFTSVSFAGGGFRTISYAPSVFYLYESRRIDADTTYHGKYVGEMMTKQAVFTWLISIMDIYLLTDDLHTSCSFNYQEHH